MASEQEGESLRVACLGGAGEGCVGGVCLHLVPSPSQGSCTRRETGYLRELGTMCHSGLPKGSCPQR